MCSLLRCLAPRPGGRALLGNHVTAAFIRIINMSAAVRVFVGRNPTLVSWTRSLGRREPSRVMTRALSVSLVHRKPDKVTHTGQVDMAQRKFADLVLCV